MIWSLVALLIFLFTLWSILDKKKYEGLPPGPPRFPIIGNIIQIGLATEANSVPPETLMKLAKKYGDVMYLDIGAIKGVVLSSYDTCMEALNNDKAIQRKAGGIVDERFDGEPAGFMLPAFDWMIIRRFSIKALRNYGFGKSAIYEETVHEELSNFIEYLEKEIDQSPTKNKRIFTMTKFFSLTIASNTWRFITGKKLPIDDERIKKFLRLINEFLGSANFGKDVTMSFPILRKLFPHMSGKVKQSECSNNIENFCMETINEHKLREDYAENPLSFMDAYLAEIKYQTLNEKQIFNERRFAGVLFDLFIASSDTLTQTLTFAILYIFAFPEVQKRVQVEIDAVAPNGVLITMKMKKRMPYTTATILEINRMSAFVPVIPRQTIEDVKIGGHSIPKGKILMVNQYAANYDDRFWNEPKRFEPERFLDSDGNVDQKLASRLFPFGAGPRLCIGHKLAEVITFLYFTSLLQKYNFRVPQGSPPPSLNHLPGFTTMPKPFDAEIERRII